MILIDKTNFRKRNQETSLSIKKPSITADFY